MASYHINDLAIFGKWLDNAAAAVFPRDPSSSRYREVHALLLSWEEDNLGVVDEIKQMEHVLKRVYHYETEQWRIPNTRSHNSLASRLTSFLNEYESKDNLLIMYYGGHGYMNDSRQCVWSCTDSAGCPTVQWSGLQTMLEQASSDVLILLDCCAAASSVSDGGNSVTELVAACGFETWAPGVGQHSFTSSLIEELQEWGSRAPISVAKLHSEVLTRIKHWNPRYAGSGHEERRKTPIYVLLANEGKPRSIHLTPMNPPNASLIDDQSSLAHSSSSPSLERDDDAREGADGADIASSQSSLSLDANSARYKGPKVLISLALEEDQALMASDWLEWLSSVPAIAKAAHVEGIYDSDSSFLLLIVPVEVWDMLPASRAVNFLAFVNSRNLLRSCSNGMSKQSEVETGPKPFASEVSYPSSPMASIPSNDSAYYGSEGMTASRSHTVPRMLSTASTENTTGASGKPAGPVYSSSELLKYNTIFLVDDSSSIEDLTEFGITIWSETVRYLKRCAAMVLSGNEKLTVRFFNSYMTKHVVSDISELQALCNFIPFGYAPVSRPLEDQLDEYMMDFAVLDSKQREVYLGLNLVIFTANDHEPSGARLAMKIVHTAESLSELGARTDQVRIQFVQIGSSRGAVRIFKHINYDLRNLYRTKRHVNDTVCVSWIMYAVSRMHTDDGDYKR